MCGEMYATCVRCDIMRADPSCSVAGVGKLLGEMQMGVSVDLSEVKKVRSKNLRTMRREEDARRGSGPESAPDERERRKAALSDAKKAALRDAEEAADANMMAAMRNNGVSNPSAAEAARLTLLSDRLWECREAGDLDHAIEAFLECRLGRAPGTAPTRAERREAQAKVSLFF